MKDAISPILNLVGVTSAVYFQRDFCAPWGMDVANTGFAQFHFVVSGEAVLRHPGGEIVTLSGGDLVVYPTGAPHTISDSATTPGEPGQAVVGAVLSGRPVFDGAGRRTRLICGHFAYDLSHRHPLIAGLPDRILLKASDILGAGPLLGLLQVIIRESNQPELGSDTMVARLADAVFVGILRACLARDDRPHGFLAALSDPRIARCVAAIHQAFPDTLSLGQLAGAAGMSRSALALTFRRRVGFGPGEYASRWKLLNAARMLQARDVSIEEVGFACGYGSPSSFTRAFRGFYGVAPSAYRRDSRATAT